MKKNLFRILFLFCFMMICVSANFAATLASIVSATASTVNGANTAALSFDGNVGTRWESVNNVDPQWIYWDLGSSQPLSQIIINWETAAASNYTIQGSVDAATWTTLATTVNSKYLVDHTTITNTLSGTYRYVKMNGTTRITGYGYSIWEVSIYVNSTASSTPTVSSSSTAVSSSGGLTQLTIVSATGSSYVNGNTANLSFDKNTGTRWESATADPQWIYWDLGSAKQLSSIMIDWEVASASNYTIQGSADAATWTILATVMNASKLNHTQVTTALSGTYRYVKMNGTTRTSPYGYSIWEASIYSGTPASSAASSTPVVSSSSSVSSTTSSSGTIVIAPIVAAVASTILGTETAAMSCDNNTGTRWESTQGVDPQWIYWDLGSNQTLNKIVIEWEVAQAASYQIQGSTDAATWTTLATVANTSQADHNQITTALSGSYRYVRMYGSSRTTVWGYSIWEVSIFVVGAPGTPVALTLQTPYIQYLEVNLTPADNFGNSALKFQNVQSNMTLNYNDGAAVTYSFGGMSLSGMTPVFKTTTKLGAAVNGTPGGSITVAAYAGQVVQIYLTNLSATSASSVSSVSYSSVAASSSSTMPPGAFSVTAPINGAMVTTTRRPTFTWNAYAGATSYDVYVNITRSDYDWHASGNLLDRFTKVGTSATTSYTMTTDLVDRWTYKWYVIANGTNSTVGQFSVYIPYVANTNDGISVINGCRDLNKDGTIEPFEDWHNPIATRLDDLMSRLTLEEKFRQCYYNGDTEPMNGFSFSYGVENGMTTAQFNAAKTRMGIPIAFAGDKIHGWKTIYPTQLGIAATRDANLAYTCGNIQRMEQKSFGFTGMLMPLAEVDTKVLYPRFQEGNGENADDAAAIIRAIVCGLQGGPELNPHSLMTTCKHWASQGAGGEGPLQYDAVTIKYHMKPWYALAEANAASVMPGYSYCPYLDPSNAGCCNSKPILDYLRNVIGFKGFIVTDWLAMTTEQSIASLGTGCDVMGGCPASSVDMNALIAAIGQARLEDGCRRVLEAKFRLGMFENPYGDPTCSYTAVDATNNHNTVLAVAKKTITLLKNNGVLPLKLTSGNNLIVAGPRATWLNSDYDPNVIWQSIYYADPLQKNYFQAFGTRSASKGVNVYLNDNSTAQAAIVVIGEQSYTHATEWSNKDPQIPADQLAVIQGFKNRGIPVVTVIISPRPYILGIVNDISDAILLVYRGGTAIEEAVASLCYGDFTPTGKLPFQMPRSMSQIGTDDPANQLEKWDLPYDLGATDAQRAAIRSAIDAGQNPVPSGDPLYQYGAGMQNF